MAEEKKTVFVELFDLSLTERKDDRFGRVLTKPLVKPDDLIRKAVARRTDINAATLKAAYVLLKDVALEEFLGGASVEFGLGYFSIGVNGIFYTDKAQWDSTQHSLSARATPTAEVRMAVKATSVNVRGAAASGAGISSVTDVVSGEQNARLTPGGPVNLTGSKIRIAGDAPGVGISLVNIETDETFAVPKNVVSTNDPSKITFVVPLGLTPGDYTLRITTQFTTSGKHLKEPRTCSFDYPLAVIP